MPVRKRLPDRRRTFPGDGMGNLRPPAAVTSRPARLIACVALAFLAQTPLSTPAADSPEYLTADRPISSSLDQSPSATDGLGGIPPAQSLFESGIRPANLLPELRTRIPPTGEPFFDDALFHVAPRAYSRHRDNGDGTKSEAFALGGALGGTSGLIADAVRIGITGYTSQELYGPENRDGSGLLRPGQQSYTVLGEAYAEFLLRDAALKIGRQLIDLPYINADDGRMTPNTFEGIGIQSTHFENFHFGAGHLTRIKGRNSSDFEHLSDFAGASGSEKGVTVAGFRWNMSENFHISAIDQYGWDTYNTLYLETERIVPLGGDFSLKTGLQFTDQHSVGDQLLGNFDAQHLGVKAALGFRSLIASTAFTWTSADAGIMAPWGGSPAYNSVMISDFDRAGEKAISAGLSCDFSGIGLKGCALSTTWLYGDTPGSGPSASPDQREFDVTFDYRPPFKGFENLWLRLRYAANEQDGGNDREDIRAIMNYSFVF